jgi:hypothetical protein
MFLGENASSFWIPIGPLGVCQGRSWEASCMIRPKNRRSLHPFHIFFSGSNNCSSGWYLMWL